MPHLLAEITEGRYVGLDGVVRGLGHATTLRVGARYANLADRFTPARHRRRSDRRTARAEALALWAETEAVLGPARARSYARSCPPRRSLG
jgi:hypothetical protein